MTLARTNTLPTANLPAAYRSDVQAFSSWLGSRAVKPETIKAYFRELEKTHRVSTLNRKKAALKKAIAQTRGSALTIAEQAQLNAVFAEVKMGKAEKAVLEHEILTREELEALIANAGKKTAAIVAALYESATRVSELLSLRLSDCEVRGETVHCEIRRGKNKQQRTVYLTRKTFETLKSLYRGKTYLLEKNDKEMSRHTVYVLLRRAGAAIGRPDIHPHTLRHTKASHLLKAGMSLPAVSAYLGHSDPAITAKYYLHDKPTPEAVLGLKEQT
jgi:integrase/recombinase XerD